MGILANKVAIVTGSGRGIGRGEALALAREGAAVAVLSRNAADVDAMAAEIEKLGSQALPLCCDVSNRRQVDAAVRRTVEAFGGIDILVNNAQAIPDPHPMEIWTEVEERLMWESGYLGTWNFMQACFPHLKARGAGRIVNTCSVVGYSNLGGYSGYAATKEAIRSLTRTCAVEWGRYNITVNVISPASLSPFVEQHYPDEESRARLLENTHLLLKRFGDAERDIGRTVVYLAGPDGGFMTGCTLSVDGGAHMIV